MSQTGDSTHISQRLEVGRQVLEGLASIASQLENAKDGLTRSAYLSGNMEELPPSVKRLWESLDKDIAAMSQNDITKKLAHLEHLLAERLTTLMPMTEKICASDARGDEIKLEGLRGQFQELSRVATTALAIRLLAHRKNFKLPPSQLPISAEALRARAQQVKTVERKHKLNVIEQMRSMVKATNEMLAMPGLDAGTREMLLKVFRDLKTNAKHLANGGSFTTMPVPIETVEMSEDEPSGQVSVDEEPELPRGQELQLLETQEMIAQESPAQPEPPQPSPPAAKVQTKPALLVAAKPPARRPSATSKPKFQHFPVAAPPQPNPMVRIWKQFRTWLRAPMGVTWTEAGLMMHDDD